MSDLQDALDTPIFVDIALPIEERRHQSKAVATLKEAARRVANPDYEAGVQAINEFTKNGWDATNNIYAIQLVVNAALSITEDPQ